MNTLTNLLKDHQVGTWCKRAAWIILAIGFLEIALNMYSVTRQFGYGSSVVNVTPGILAQIAALGIATIPSILFYFFILYAAGALVDQVVAGADENSYMDVEEENDDLAEDEEVKSDQMR